VPTSTGTTGFGFLKLNFDSCVIRGNVKAALAVLRRGCDPFITDKNQHNGALVNGFSM
jgi:hypothetical protein